MKTLVVGDGKGFLDGSQVGRDITVPTFPAAGPAATPGPQVPSFVNVETTDDLAGPITITVRQAQRATTGVASNDPQYANAVVRAKWGSGGVQHSAEIDVGRGTTFTLHGSWARVEGLGQFGIDDISPTILSGNVNESPTKLQASAAYGTAPAAAPPATRTIVVVSVANGGGLLGPGATTAAFPVPPFSRRAIVLSSAAFPTVNWQRAPGEVIAATVSSASPIVVPPSACFFTLTSPGAPGIAELRVVFELAL